MSASEKIDKELMQLDLYEILHISIDASRDEIRKAFRKCALDCHPDKNPDNPLAAAEFDRLKKINEVLIDKATRSAYDKALKGRRLAVLRSRENRTKNQKLRNELDRREREAKEKISESERKAQELQRQQEENARFIAEEMARQRQQDLQNRQRASSRVPAPHSPTPPPSTACPGSHKVKVRWQTADGAVPYTKDQIYKLFFKWGEINAVAIKQKGSKGTAIVDYKDKSGAEMARQYELGLPDCPVTVTECGVTATAASETPTAAPVAEHRVVVTWKVPSGAKHYCVDELRTLFYKWGEIVRVTITESGEQGTATVDYEQQGGADLACQYETGLPGRPLTVTVAPSTAAQGDARQTTGSKRARDFESLADMEKRRRNERARLMADIMRNDGICTED